MKTRIITAAVLAPLLVLLLIFGNGYSISAVVFLASLIGLYEFNSAVGLKEKKAVCLIGYIGGAAVSAACVFKEELIPLALILILAALFADRLLENGKVTTENIALEIFAVVYVPLLFSHVSMVRNMPSGRFFVWFVVVGAFITDTAAYFTGVFLGKHKLCPKISPKKTVEGAIGGILGCAVSFLVMGICYNKIYSESLNLLFVFAAGVVCAVVSEVGDLAASIVKREFGIKDYGSLLPGHGGILDRCDSLIFVAPFVYYMLRVILAL